MQTRAEAPICIKLGENMANYTGIYSDTLLAGSFDASQFDGVKITEGIPVRLLYRVLPGQEIAFGSGSNN